MNKRFHCPHLPMKLRDGEDRPTCGTHHNVCRHGPECLDFPKTAQPTQTPETKQDGESCAVDPR
jgi:hypothetical protein